VSSKIDCDGGGITRVVRLAEASDDGRGKETILVAKANVAIHLLDSRGSRDGASRLQKLYNHG
jgi:hypothetical protein